MSDEGSALVGEEVAFGSFDLDEDEYKTTRRELCEDCKRPLQCCYCSAIPAAKLKTRTCLCIVQHPREAKTNYQTVPIVQRCLEACSVFRCTKFDKMMGRSEYLRTLTREKSCAVLFPSPGAPDLATMESKPDVLFIVDGTWQQACHLVQWSETLRKMPKVMVKAREKGLLNKLRVEPDEKCVSTLEAIANALRELEEDGDAIYQTLLDPLKVMVDRQCTIFDKFAEGNQMFRAGREKGTETPGHLNKLWYRGNTSRITR